MQVGVVNQHNELVGRVGLKTRAAEGRSAVIGRIVSGVQEACENAGVSLKQIDAVGIVAPGAIDIPSGTVLEAPNLKWKNVPLRTLLENKLRCRVCVDNDVNGAIWGEHVLGANRPQKGTRRGGDVLGVWVGTGVGGGLVIGDRLYYGDFFTAGEIGHTVLFPHGTKGRTTVEDFCSRTGMSRTIRLLLPKFPKSLLQKGSSKTTGSKQLAEAYRKGDKLAVQVVDEAADLLGIAIANWVTVLSLDTVILGGGVTEALGAPYLKRIRASFQAHVFPKRCRKASLLKTELYEDAGLLGAALLARDMLLAKQ